MTPTEPPPFVVRDAVDFDVPSMTAIYNALIATTTIEWRDEPYREDDRLRWQRDQESQGCPVLVAVDRDGAVIGWASYSPFRDNHRWPGYQFTVEHSVHVEERWWGYGVGRTLMEALLERGTAAGLHAMIAAIDGSTPGPIEFHRRLGFTEVGRLPEVGAKHGRWLDLILMQRML